MDGAGFLRTTTVRLKSVTVSGCTSPTHHCRSDTSVQLQWPPALPRWASCRKLGYFYKLPQIGITFGLDHLFFHSILSDQTFIIIIIIIFIVTSDEINCNSVFSSASEMTYIVSGGALNSTHSLNCNLGLIHVTKMFPCVFY